MPKTTEHRFLITLLVALCISIAPIIYSWPRASIAEKSSYAQSNEVSAALHLLRPLAENGDAEAQYRIGQLYEEALEVANSGTNALEWYKQSAEQGHAHAQFSLGRLFVVGHDISQDYVQAYKWFILSESGLPESDTRARAQAAKARETISPMMTPAQISKAKKLAASWAPN